MIHANDVKAIASRVRLEKEKKQREEKTNLEQEKVKTVLDKLVKRIEEIECDIKYEALLGGTVVFIGAKNGDKELNLKKHFEKMGYKFKDDVIEYGDHISGDSHGYYIYW